MRKLPNVPFVEARYFGTKHKPSAILLSLSSTTSDKGAALGVANRMHQHDAPLRSYHYAVDASEVYRCVPDGIASHSHPYNSISVLVCAQPQDYMLYWELEVGRRVLERTADLVADLCLAHKIRPRYILNGSEAKWMSRRTRRRGGIIVKVLGAWPYVDFLDEVELAIKRKTM